MNNKVNIGWRFFFLSPHFPSESPPSPNIFFFVFLQINLQISTFWHGVQAAEPGPVSCEIRPQWTEVESVVLSVVLVQLISKQMVGKTPNFLEGWQRCRPWIWLWIRRWSRREEGPGLTLDRDPPSPSSIALPTLQLPPLSVISITVSIVNLLKMYPQ